MRVDFVKAVHQVLQEDEGSIFVTGDLGYNALEGIGSAFPNRFLNAGVAEQNMMGLAAGIALAGHRPWVYSIAPFTTYRCLEQIRNDVCLHNLPVRIVGNGGGYTYGVMGSTHHAVEDLAVLKVLPNMQLFFPCSNNQVAAAVKQMSTLQSPSYLRLAISGFPTNDVPIEENSKTLTRRYLRGNRVTVIGVGHAIQIALSAKHDLTAKDVDLFGIARFPFDLESDHALVESVRRTSRVIILEEHYQPGSIAESLRTALPNIENFTFMTARYLQGQKYGSSTFHLKQCGLTPENLLQEIRRILD
ncbi:MAG: transketolase family protein [Bdellovibrionia bacterium]